MTHRLLFFLSFKALFLAAVVFFGAIELGPDEAQYWTWSRALDWGYYSKPPGIAWQIWLGTTFFGQTEWGVRALSIILGFCQAFALYFLALRCGLHSRAAFWCGMMMAFSPIGFLGSFLAVTDVGFILCWTLGCLTIATALQKGEKPNPLIVGFWIMMGALFKWPIYLLWLYVFFLPGDISNIPRKSFKEIAGVFLSLCGLLPSIWWNGVHHWVTFRHVFATLQGGSGKRAGANFLEFIGMQAALLSPILFVLLLIAIFRWMQHRKELKPALVFCGFVSVSALAFGLILSCFQKIQGNWIALAYPTSFVLIGWNTLQRICERTFWVKAGVVFSAVLCCLGFVVPSFYLNPSISPYMSQVIPYRLNPFKQNMGWKALSDVLSEIGYDPKLHFLAGDKYQVASELSFYSRGQKRAYFLNLQGMRNNQFVYWPSLQSQENAKEGFFIWVENQPRLRRDWDEALYFYTLKLKEYFEVTEFVELVPLITSADRTEKGALIFRCKNPLPITLNNSDLY